jgi:hypothetical protein
VSELHTALSLAVRHLEDPQTTELEREAVLASVAVHFSGEVGETAARTLFHLREQRKLQLTLRGVLQQPVAPAKFIGRQDGLGVIEGFDLYLLTADIPGHPMGSTVSAQTLTRLGFRLPPKAA